MKKNYILYFLMVVLFFSVLGANSAFAQEEINDYSVRKPGANVSEGEMSASDTLSDGDETIEPSVFTSLSAADLSKFQDEEMRGIFQAGNADISSKKAAEEFFVLMSYNRDKKPEMIARIKEIGGSNVYFYQFIDFVSFQSTGATLSKFVAGNDNIAKIFPNSVNYLDGVEEATPKTVEMITIADDDLPSRPGDESSQIESTIMGSGLDAISSIPSIHGSGYYGSGKYVAILDTGLDANHQMFSRYGNKIAYPRCFSTDGFGGYTSQGWSIYSNIICWENYGVSSSSYSAYPYYAFHKTSAWTSADENDAFSVFSHGSHVAGIAAGWWGVAPLATIIPVQVFSYRDYAYPGGYRPYGGIATAWTSDIIKGLEYVLSLKRAGVDIAAVNMSLGYGAFSAPCDDIEPWFSEVIKQLYYNGVNVVVSAGNNSYNGRVGSPGCIELATTVGSVGGSDPSNVYRSDFSNMADMVDIMAPGENLISASLLPSNYCYMSGTSMAAPVVTGGIALTQGKFGWSSSNGHTSQFLAASTTVSVSSGVYSGVYKKPVLNFYNLFGNNYNRPARLDMIQATSGNGMVRLRFPKIENATYYQMYLSTTGPYSGFDRGVSTLENDFVISGLPNNVTIHMIAVPVNTASGLSAYSYSPVTAFRPDASGVNGFRYASGDDSGFSNVATISFDSFQRVNEIQIGPDGKVLIDPITGAIIGDKPGDSKLVVKDESKGNNNGDEGSSSSSSGSSSKKAAVLPNTGFAPNRITQLKPMAQPYSLQGAQIKLSIPSIYVKATVLGIPAANGGEYDVSWLGNNVGWLQDSAFPGRFESGNAVITGHNVGFDGKPGVFDGLERLSYNDKIYIDAFGERYTYTVSSIETVYADTLKMLSQKTDLSELTLITCKFFNEKTGDYDGRIAVKAVLDSVGKIN